MGTMKASQPTVRAASIRRSSETPTPLPNSSDAADPSRLRGLNTWIELSRSAYLGNMAFLRRCVGSDVELSAVVKANAYGHGLLPIAGLAIEGGADSFCVHSVEEALELRAAGFEQDILVMGHVPVARLESAIDQNLSLVLYHGETLDALDRLTRARDQTVNVHLKLETGTHRQGVSGAELEALLHRLGQCPGVLLEGVYTHFANIEDTTDHSYARLQMERFEAALRRVTEAGLSPSKRHAACSAAAILFPSTHFDFVRVGISQYGFWSSNETLLSYELGRPPGEVQGLRPVLTWKTRVSQVKWVEAGQPVGYGCSHRTTRRTRLAILPIGYSDGYDRGLSSASSVLIHGRRAPVCGRICMNLTMVDVTDMAGVEVEDEVVLLGSQGDETVGAQDLAAVAGTIHYEVVARLSRGIPRVVVD